jgi:amino acid adenylation domain-containing protein
MYEQEIDISERITKRLIFDSQLKAERDYWMEAVSRVVTPTGLRTDFERPASDSGRRESVPVHTPDEVAAGLSRITKDSPLLVYTALLAALNICLAQYANADTVVVGSPARLVEGAERQTPNALSIVTRLDGRESFKKLILRLRETLIEAYARQSYHVEYLLRDLDLVGVENRCPLFDVALALRELHVEPPELHQDITLVFSHGPAGLRGELTFNPDLFRRETVEIFGRRFATLLARALTNLDSEVSGLEMLEEEERRVLDEWNRTEAEFPRERCVHELFGEQAERAPDAVALAWGDEHITYGDLDRRSNQLARHLRRLDVGPESRVGLMMERSPELIVGLLGVLKAGGAYVPLDPQYPPARLAFMLRDAAAALVLTQERFIPLLPVGPLLPEGGARTVALDAQWEIIAREPASPLTRTASPANAAYVIYTSGSTGQPKGVSVEHRGVCNLVHAQRRAFRIEPESRVFQFAPFSFDASVSEIFTALASGGALDLGSPGLFHGGEELARELRERADTVVTLPPTLLSDMPADELPALRTLVSAGEACTREIVARWSKGRRFINAYGPTETSVCASLKVFEGGDDADPYIGRPLANMRLYTTGAGLRLSPAGVPGELCAAGVGLARGYLNRPELTAERFCPDPFAGEFGARLYRTGDVARFLHNGEIECLGRADYQVKVRGFRIELGEIEAALRGHDRVREAVAVVLDEGAGQRALVAYVVPRADEMDGAPALDGAELRGYLQERLPGYMTPSVIVTLERLPLTRNGKVDRKALPAPDQRRRRTAAEFVAPRNAVEQLMADIWAEVLRVEKVGVADNFFELGGNSLLVIQVVSRIRDIFHVDAPINAMFESPTIGEFVERLPELCEGEFDEEKIAQLIAEIDGLTEEEAENIVAMEDSQAAII